MPPDVGHRTHWNAKLIGVVPVQSPVVADSVDPTIAEPVIFGSAVLRGTACATARADPLVNAAVTRAAATTAPDTR